MMYNNVKELDRLIGSKASWYLDIQLPSKQTEKQEKFEIYWIRYQQILKLEHFGILFI